MKKSKLKPYFVGYNTVSKKKLNSVNIVNWKGSWFKTKIVSAKSMADARKKVSPKKNIYNVQAFRISKRPKNRWEKVKILKAGKVVRIRKKR